jgi:OOP family OmpA-OmpF porin
MKRIVFAFIAAISCSIALAAEPATYISASVGGAEQKYEIPGGSLTDNDTGLQIAGGYRITPNFGVEVGYASFGTATASAAGATVSAKPRSFYGAVTGSYNVTSQFAFTGKLGAAHNRTKLQARASGYSESLTETDTSFMYGVGVSYAYTPNIALIAEYQDFGKVAKSDADESLKAHVISVGVRYSF